MSLSERAASLARRLSALKERWPDGFGDGAIFLIYLAAGTIVMVFLFYTVHSRSIDKIQAVNQRFHRVVQTWIEHGYLKHGGLAFTQAGEADPGQRVWRSSSMGFLQGAHLLERLHYLVRGRYSYRLMTLHNQGVVLLTAAVVALLAMHLATLLGLSRDRAFLLGLGCQCVYQTFPQNLYYFWEILPPAVLCLPAAAWLLFEVHQLEAPAARARPWVRAAAIFAMAWIEPFSATFIIATFVLALYLLAREQLRRVPVFLSVILPALAAAALLFLQVQWARYRFPSALVEGSEFGFRTGLDGSVEYVRGHWDLVNRKFPEPNWPINDWKALFLSGAAALILVFVLRLTTKLPLHRPVFVLAVSLGLYVPFAFTFFQAVAIHPYGYDVYLLLPIVVALFGVAPAALEMLTKQTGLFVFASLIAAWCMAWMQLRTYVMQYPMPWAR